jgi:hypothetical protein
MMATNAELAVKLLRSAAGFFRSVGEQNVQIKEQMDTNAQTYDMVAEWLEEDPSAESPVAVEMD